MKLNCWEHIPPPSVAWPPEEKTHDHKDHGAWRIVSDRIFTPQFSPKPRLQYDIRRFGLIFFPA